MRESINDRDRDQPFAMKIEKNEGGEYKATSKSYPHVSATGSTFKLAYSRLNQELQTRHREGRLKEK